METTAAKPPSRHRDDSTTDPCNALNRVLTALREDILVEKDARLATRAGSLSEHLRRQAMQRDSFADDVHAAIAALGGEPDEGASGLAWLRSILRHARAWVGGTHEGDAYRAVVDAEERTAKAYALALSGWLPDDARHGLLGQQARIVGDLEEARRLRAQH